MDKIIWIIVIVIAGIALPIQAGLNAKMGKEINNPVAASFISFSVGAIALMVYMLITRTGVKSEGFQQLPFYTWFAGVLGAFYVASVVIVFPKLGSALTFSLIVAGQLLASIFLDHFNILVGQQHSFNLQRLAGILLVMVGVFLIRKY